MSKFDARPEIARVFRTLCAPSTLQGGTIDHDWGLDRALVIGDRATGTHVLTEMYAKWKDKPVHVDLPKLWGELGIRSVPDGGIEFVPNAPLANIRDAIARKAPADSAP